MSQKRRGRPSGREDRWPIVKEMMELGFCVEDIAQATGVSTHSITSDMREGGGIQRSFPSRPTEPEKIYKAMLARYAHEHQVSRYRDDEQKRVWDALEPWLKARLEITALEGFVRGLFEAHASLCVPGAGEEMTHEMQLGSDVLELPSVRLDDASRTARGFFYDFLGSVFEEAAQVPSSREECEHMLTQRFRARASRKALCGTFASEKFVLAVGNALAVLSDRNAQVLRWLYGIGCDEKSATGVAVLMSVTHTRVGQIRDESLEMIRTSVHCDEIRRSVGDFAFVHNERDTALAEVERLRGVIAQMRDEDRDLYEILRRRVETLKLSTSRNSATRLRKLLRYLGIETIGQLVNCTRRELYHLRKIGNVGKKSLDDLESELNGLGIGLGGKDVSPAALALYRTPDALLELRKARRWTK